MFALLQQQRTLVLHSLRLLFTSFNSMTPLRLQPKLTLRSEACL